MSYSEVRNDVENLGYEKNFINLFYKKENALKNLELAKEQLRIEQVRYDSINSDFVHFMTILAKDGIIKSEDNNLIVRYVEENVIWEARLNQLNNEITCNSYYITDFKSKEK